MSNQKEAKIVELQEALDSLLRSYRDLSKMSNPEWEVSREQSYKDAKRLVDGKYSSAFVEEFYHLRDMSWVAESAVEAHLEIGRADTEEEREEALKSLGEAMLKLDEMIQKHISLKEDQGIYRPDSNDQ